MSQVSSSHVSLGPLCEGRLEKYYAWRNDPEIYRWCRQYEPLTWDQHRRWYNSLDGNTSIKMYELLVKGVSIGVCGLTSIDYINRTAEFSLYVGREHWGERYGFHGLRALLDHGFNTLGMEVIWGETFDGNPALKTFEEIGFHRDGIRRRHYFRNGGRIDAHLLSITAEEFNGRSSS